jgi:hypothetical protein
MEPLFVAVAGVLLVAACGGGDEAGSVDGPHAGTASPAVTAVTATPAALTAPEVLQAYRAATAAGDRTKAADLLADAAVFAIGYEESGRRVLTVGGPIDKATFFANAPTAPSLPVLGDPRQSSPTSITVPYQRPAPGAGVALQRGVYVVTTKEGRITSYLDYVDITDPDGLKYLTYVMGGKDPRTLPEIPPPADAGK